MTAPSETTRTCGTCSKCCEGWLHADIYGEAMYPGKPCRFHDADGCSIYAQRPHEPCVTYSCAWLSDKNVPRWMKPETCGVIMSWRRVEGIDFLDAVETKGRMDPAILSWLFMQNVNRSINIRYMVDGGRNWVGSKEFLALMARQS